uniref:Uncharacterized protein n=1 Tax=Archangium gephyra TaxID=48 RepID=A0A3S7UYA4_9BACT|nr:hypothetical protein [Archangium gephyra]
MRERSSENPTHRPAAWPLLAVVMGALLASLLALSWRVYRPMRLSDGQWVMTRISVTTWPEGYRSRNFGYGVDGFLRRDWDWDADGVYDCREDYCQWKSSARWAACVSYRYEGEWVPAPQAVLDCESLSKASPAHDGKQEGGGM